MNYACVIFGGLTIFVAMWWFFGASRNGYEGPKAISGIIAEIEQVKKGSINERRRSGTAV
jgi:choline transport protein